MSPSLVNNLRRRFRLVVTELAKPVRRQDIDSVTEQQWAFLGTVAQGEAQAYLATLTPAQLADAENELSAPPSELSRGEYLREMTTWALSLGY
jgi:hypothetical protein